MADTGGGAQAPVSPDSSHLRKPPPVSPKKKAPPPVVARRPSQQAADEPTAGAKPNPLSAVAKADDTAAAIPNEPAAEARADEPAAEGKADEPAAETTATTAEMAEETAQPPPLLGARVSVKGYPCLGVVTFVGTHHVAEKGERVLVNLDEPLGKNNGTVDGKSFGICIRT